MKIRTATIEDLDQIRELFYETITTVNSKDYNPDQVAVWASGYENIEGWTAKINEQQFLVAENDGTITGFGSITNEGYLDFMYVHKDYQGRGIATKLLAKLEMLVNKMELTDLTSDVSITAKPFFLKHGFTVIEEQSVVVNGVTLTNYKMTKHLSRPLFLQRFLNSLFKR